MKISKCLPLLVVLAALSTTPLQAFNDSKCDYFRNKKHHERTFPLSLFTSSTRNGTSSSQFTTSWGPCAALGMREQRQEFIAENSDELTLQAAQGRGEVLESLAQLSGCASVKSREQFIHLLRKNFATIYFKDGKPTDVVHIVEGIDRLIQATPELTSACQERS